MKKGLVYLVGAGPGRPDLITVAGARALSQADAVVLDALVDRRLLRHCREGVEIVDAGKRGHGKVLLRQGQINQALASLARRGKTVVRLKGGDPFVFGRGGEEGEFLNARGIAFEVVPGVSSISAVPAHAGIPLTHRGLASTVTVVTGHGRDDNPYLRESRSQAAQRTPPSVKWELIPRDGTLVVLMGLAHLPDIARRLVAAGWSASTPAAVVQWGSWAQQKSVRGTLADIGAKARVLGPPAVIVVGRVVGLAKTLNWFERRPLFGRTVMVTRAPLQAAALGEVLEAAGARVVEAPAIRIEPIPLKAEARRSLARLKSYDGILFSSANAAGLFAGHWRGRAWPADVPVYAVGPKTAEALQRSGLPVTATAADFVAEGLLALLGQNIRGKRFLFPRALEARETLTRFVERAGGTVDVVPLYRNRPVKLSADARRALLSGGVDVVTFTASSTARSFLENFTAPQRRRIFSRTQAASIGPITSQALRAAGVKPAIVAARGTTEDLARAVVEAYS